MTDQAEGGGRAAVTKPVVTLFEMYGSGAAEIGPKVAETLGVPWVPQALSSESIEEAEVARASDPDEGVLSRILRMLGGTPNPLQDDSGGQALFAALDHQMISQNTRTVLEATRNGGVILGRNATVILADRPHTVHVLLTGRVEDRVARAARAARISADQAARRQVREDAVRREMSQRLYAWDPQDPARYDVVINTSRIDVPRCAEIILLASRL
jgi:Cytidylate kinase-like family